MKYFLFFAVLIFVAVSWWTIKAVGKQNNISLSMHVAKSKKTSLIFGIGGSIATIAASVAVFSGLMPHVNAHFFVYGIFIVIFAQFFVTVLLPHVEGTKRGVVHNLAAWGMCYTIPIATGAFVFTQINAVMKTLTVAALALEIILLAIALGIASQRKYFLYYQLAYLGLFFIYLLVLMWD